MIPAGHSPIPGGGEVRRPDLSSDEALVLTLYRRQLAARLAEAVANAEEKSPAFTDAASLVEHLKRREG